VTVTNLPRGAAVELQIEALEKGSESEVSTKIEHEEIKLCNGKMLLLHTAELRDADSKYGRILLRCQSIGAVVESSESECVGLLALSKIFEKLNEKVARLSINGLDELLAMHLTYHPARLSISQITKGNTNQIVTIDLV